MCVDPMGRGREGRRREEEEKRERTKNIERWRDRGTIDRIHCRQNFFTCVQAVLEQLFQSRHGPLHDLPGGYPVDEVRGEALNRALLELLMKELIGNRRGRGVGCCRGSCLLCSRRGGVFGVEGDDGSSGAVDVHCLHLARREDERQRERKRREKERKKRNSEAFRRPRRSALFSFFFLFCSLVFTPPYLSS